MESVESERIARRSLSKGKVDFEVGAPVERSLGCSLQYECAYRAKVVM